MCYHYSPAHLERLQKLYPDKFGDLEFTDYANGFTHPKLPSITKNDAGLVSWGLIPHWTKDWEAAKKMQQFCLNAKIETLAEKPSFRDALEKKQFCILPASNFYEWQWQDAKGKVKTKFEIKLPKNELINFAGLYSNWLDKDSGEIVETFTIITCPANDLMSKIHNTKKRMPIILDYKTGTDWINGNLDLDNIQTLAQEQKLVAEPITE